MIARWYDIHDDIRSPQPLIFSCRFFLRFAVPCARPPRKAAFLFLSFLFLDHAQIHALDVLVLVCVESLGT